MSLFTSMKTKKKLLKELTELRKDFEAVTKTVATLRQYISQLENTSDVPNKHTPTQKAEEILNKKRTKRKCIKAGICDICGEPLTTRVEDYGHLWDVIHTCPIHGVRHTDHEG